LPFVGWGAGFVDYDNDGWLDLFVANGHVYPQVDRAGVTPTYRQRKLLYRNRRDGTFAEIGQDGGPAIAAAGISRGVAFGDLDNDGDLDVVIADLDGAPTLLRNEVGARNNFLVVELVGTKSNRSGLGARVTAGSGDLVQIEERRSGGSYISQNDTRLHFGLDQRSSVASVQVRWPGGAKQQLTNVPANSFITVTEGESGWRVVRRK
jgi:enediyne biosynthesis protein E4